MRDITLAETIYIFFTTRAFATGIPTVLAGSPVVSAYEDNSATQITAGITLGVSHDSVAGLNLLTIVATGGNGFEASKDYTLVITTGTVDSVSVVGEVVGEFTIGRSAAATDLANGTDGLGALKTETAAILVDTGTTLQAELDAIQAAVITNAAGADVAADIIALKAETALIVADTNELQVDNVPGLIATAQADLDIITGASGVNLLTATQASIDAIEVDTGTTLQAEVDAIQAAVITNAAGADVAADIIALKTETALIVADTNELQVDWVNGGRLDLLIDAIKVATDTITAAHAEPTGAPAANETPFEKLGYIFAALRNQIDATASAKTFYNDAGASLWSKSTSDDGTTYSEAEGT